MTILDAQDSARVDAMLDCPDYRRETNLMVLVQQSVEPLYLRFLGVADERSVWSMVDQGLLNVVSVSGEPVVLLTSRGAAELHRREKLSEEGYEFPRSISVLAATFAAAAGGWYLLRLLF